MLYETENGLSISLNVLLNRELIVIILHDSVSLSTQGEE